MQVRFPFRDYSLPVKERVDDLLSRLTVAEVINQTVCYMLNATPGIPRLEISPYVWDTECMRGQMMSNGTAFPQNLGLAATFR
jgi:beta-glucosidase